MTREDLKEIVVRVIENVQACEQAAPEKACFFWDEAPPCEDMVMRYAIPNPDNN